MKHIIIAGASRSGKTTLSMLMRKKGFVHYKMDSIKRGLDNNFYEGRISEWRDASPKMAHLIGTIINECKTDIIKNLEWYVIDTCHLYPKDIVKENLKDTIIIFLGFPNLTVDKKLEQIRLHDPMEQWTHMVSDEQLRINIGRDIEFSKEVEKECKELGIPFFDTGKNYQKTMASIYKMLKEEAGVKK